MPTDYDVIQCMYRYGGGFVRTLAQLFEKGDPENQRRIKAAWPEYWQQYAEMVPHMKAHDEAQRRLDAAGR